MYLNVSYTMSVFMSEKSSKWLFLLPKTRPLILMLKDFIPNIYSLNLLERVRNSMFSINIFNISSSNPVLPVCLDLYHFV